jgi:hypothetical protein
MSLETELAGALGRAADAHHPAAPDLPALRAGGRRRARRRTAVRVGVGLAALAAVALGAAPWIVDGGASSRPEPAAPSLDELPFGEPPSIPYCPGDRTIVAGDSVIATPCDVLVTRGGSTLYMGDPRGITQVREDELPVLLDRSGPGHWFPGLSNDGRWAAWITDSERDPRLVVADLVRSEVVAEEPWAYRDGWVPGIDDLGRVYTVDLETAAIHLYEIATREVHEVTGTPDHPVTAVRFVTADGIAVRHTDPSGSVTVGRVDAEGRFTADHETTWDWVHWSPDRSRAVRDSAAGLVVSATDRDEPDVRLGVPEEGSATWVPVWEDESHVLVQYDPVTSDAEGLVSDTDGLDVPARGTWLLRCSADTGDCEVALEPGWGDRLTYPAYR